MFLLLLSCQLEAQTKKENMRLSTLINIPMTGTQWDYQQGKVDFITYKGVQAARLNENSGYMICKGLNFKNGTIEFDVEVNQPSPFPTIYFHWLNNNETEHVYLRTAVYNKSDAPDAIQYASIVKGVNLWDLQYEFQSTAHIKIKEWNHVKIVVSGKQLRAYINYAKEPNLNIPCLEGNTTEGKIGLGTGFPGQSIFSNLAVKPGATEGVPSSARRDTISLDKRYIRQWQVTQPDFLPDGKEITASLLPGATVQWENIHVERRGLVNLSRKFGGSDKRRYVWLRTKIKSTVAQSAILKMGFSDELWVFLNKQTVYQDKNLYLQNMRKYPDGRISVENCSFPLPLKQGDNELLIGVANNFYGWGIMARFEKIHGIQLNR
jgi:hypothetical protein